MEERGIKQYVMAADLRAAGFKVSRTHLNRMLNDRIEMPLGVFLFLLKVLGEPPSAFLGDADALPAEFRQTLHDFVESARRYLHPDRERAESDGTRVVPLLRVAATPDNETYDDVEPRTCEVPAAFYTRHTMAFEVVGDSMSGDGIVSGDIVYTTPPKNEAEAYGEIVVAMINGYRHLKRLQYRRGRIHLVSSGRGHKSWKFQRDSRAFKILGIVTGRSGRVAR
ncbi:MAG TPA: S24 family peptidase [Thermoanaerobaculia bacterium]|jgi:SOS-response transcriptional repressor LexA|nr:S24 family peptidase [Thermoanaerobaculia bacterium]